MRYTEVQRIFAEVPFGLQNYWKGEFLADLSPEVMDLTAASFDAVTSDHSVILIEAPHGAVHRVDEGETAFGQRRARYNVSALAIWEDPGDSDRHIGWARAYADALKPFASGGYVNYLGDDASPDDVAAAYGLHRYRRLSALKSEYDPTNVFRFNQNIAPLGHD
jgi:hypothetical protein